MIKETEARTHPMKIQLNAKQAINLKTALHHWQQHGLIDQTTAHALEDNIEVLPFDWKRLAKYSFWLAIICTIIAISSVLMDKVLLDFLQTLFNAPHAVKCVGLGIISIALFWAGIKRRLTFPEKIYSNEAVLFLAVLTTAGTVYQLGRTFDTGTGHFSVLLLLSFFIYAVLAFIFKSNLIWLFSLLSFGGWLGAETGYASGWGSYYLGMNYPLRYVLLGIILTAFALYFGKKHWLQFFYRVTLVIGLLFLFIALWLLSIFGNHGDFSSWQDIKQIELFHWSFLFGIFAGAGIYHGLRFDNAITKGFGVTFIFINLYTRYFEYFWDATHKAFFFALLAASFWFLGSKAETIWYLGKTKEHK